MGHAKSVKQLARFLAYVLGRRPDEFGLVPDADGFVKIRDLLKALSVEAGWKHVRRSHLNELLLLLPDPGIEVNEPLVRASRRDRLCRPSFAENPPKLLYTCVRPKAYPRVIEKGLFSGADPGIVLCGDREMAAKIGRRLDARPVLLTVQVQKAVEQGVLFSKSGEFIYLARSIPADCISGPPLPRHPREPAKNAIPQTAAAGPHAGSFLIELPAPGNPMHPRRSQMRKKEIAWKKERRQARRKKRESWPPD